MAACNRPSEFQDTKEITETLGKTDGDSLETGVIENLVKPTKTPRVVSTWDWPRSTPEEQGLSSEVLANMLEKIDREDMPIHSILVIRHGVLVLEAYVHPFNSQTRHGVYSVTKSVTSALTGIAMNNGLLGEVGSPVASYFPEVMIDDPVKSEITIENLLSMNSGVEWTEPLHSGLSDLWWILEADDPVQYFFTPAVIKKPGSTFNYNSGGTHVLSVMIQNASGMKAAKFAEEHLFSALGIYDYYWNRDLSGHSVGGTGLELLPVDMAKIGQLYLNKGTWQGEQVIPARWVEASACAHSYPSEIIGYGYQWWIRPQGDYYALGWGGQQIRVFPDQDMVLVITSGSSGNEILHDDLVDQFILPAIVSDHPLASILDNDNRLNNALDKLAAPELHTFSARSSLADQVTGKEWLVTGMGDWSMFSLDFSGEESALLTLTTDGDPILLEVGLDGYFRITDTIIYGPVAMLGYWNSDDTFVIEQQNLREADRRTTFITFTDDQASLLSEWFVEPYIEETVAEVFN